MAVKAACLCFLAASAFLALAPGKSRSRCTDLFQPPTGPAKVACQLESDPDPERPACARAVGKSDPELQIPPCSAVLLARLVRICRPWTEAAFAAQPITAVSFNIQSFNWRGSALWALSTPLLGLAAGRADAFSVG